MRERAGTSSWPSWISHFTGSFVGHSPSEMLCPPAEEAFKTTNKVEPLGTGVDTHTHTHTPGVIQNETLRHFSGESSL